MTRCTSCRRGLYLKGDTCEKLIDCKEGEFRTEENLCKKCSDSCLTCENKETKCTNCKDGAIWREDNTCEEIVECKEGEFKTKENKCDKCDDKCKTCEEEA